MHVGLGGSPEAFGLTLSSLGAGAQMPDFSKRGWISETPSVCSPCYGSLELLSAGCDTERGDGLGGSADACGLAISFSGAGGNVPDLDGPWKDDRYSCFVTVL